MPPRALALLTLLPALPLVAQDEGALRTAFEGRTVTVLLDMPATSSGVNVHPERSQPIDFSQLASRLKDHGTAIRRGESVMVTKVRVKKSHIEFQLGGGGYGTFGDEVAPAPGVVTAPQGKSRREEDLERQVRAETDRDKRRQLQRELDDLRRTRERENARLQVEQEQARQLAEANLRDRRLDAGSRFNVHYADAVPAAALTPAGLQAALAAYVRFDATPVGAPGPEAERPGGIAALRKGMSLAELEAALGPAVVASRTTRDGQTTARREYETGGQRIVATLVNGVLVDYAITPLDADSR